MAAHPPAHADVALNLALAMVASSTAPLLLLDGKFRIVAASASFCRVFGIRSVDVPGRELRELGGGEWDVPQLRGLLETTASGDAQIDAYEMDLRITDQKTRRLVVNVQKLYYGLTEEVRLLVTVSDVTEARLSDKLRDDLLREKSVMLQEVQHRVANSLQIIASVILQSARKVQSEETRLHLHDAHSRVMSVAALQQQLAASQLGEVELREYFTKLCKSIGASMIRDHNQLALEVEVDDTTVTADISISLGLIVTELVINALKHAFPGGRHGMITVAYKATGLDWALSVADDGVGMPKSEEVTKGGLGTSIVNALATQLDAEVRVGPSGSGTIVSVFHANPADASESGRIVESAV